MGCTTTTAMLTIHNMATWMIATWAPVKLKICWSDQLVTGDKLASVRLTEPGAGSMQRRLKQRRRKLTVGMSLTGLKCLSLVLAVRMCLL